MKYLSLALTALLFTIGCGGGSSSPSGGDISGINVHVTSPVGPGAVDAGLTLPITVEVTGDSSKAGVIWSVAAQHRGDPAGTLTDIKSDSVTYNPPSPDQVTAALQVTVTATSVTDPTRAAAISVAVYPALSITTKSSDLATAFLNTDYTCIQSFARGKTVTQIPCTVDATGGLGPYTWSLSANALPDGMLLVDSPANPPSTTSSKIVGKPTLSGIFPFSLTVKDSLGGSNTASFGVSVAPVQLKVTTPTLVSTVAGVPYVPVVLHASGGVPPYTWSLAPGLDPTKDLPPGMQLSPDGVLSGTPLSDSLFQFALRVRDSQSPVPDEGIFPAPKLPGQSDTNIINLGSSGIVPECVKGSNGLLPGAHYAFLFSGFDPSGPMTYSGSLTADADGNLTGVEDIIRKSGAQLNQPVTSGGPALFDARRRGCMTLNTSSTSSQFRLIVTAIDPLTTSVIEAQVIEFDDSDGSGTRGSGFIRRQDESAFPNSPSGSYAFALSGWNATGGHFAMAGTATSQTGLLTSISADVNNGGNYSAALTGGSGTVSAVDANGRGTLTLGIGAAAYDLIFYVVDAQTLVFNSTQTAGGGHPLITGLATSTAAPYGQTSLTNSHIYQMSGQTPGSSDLGIGVLHFGAGTLSGTAFARRGGVSSTASLSGLYSVDPASGRVSFSGTAIPAVGYLTSSSTGASAYLVGTGSSATSGSMEFQTDSYPPGYQFSPLVGDYGFVIKEMLDAQTQVMDGKASTDANGNMPDSFIDTSALPSQGGLLEERNYKLFRYTWSPDGSGTFGANTYMVTNGAKFFYIDTSTFNGHPAVVVGQLQSPPAIANFTPTCGPVGATVVIAGVDLLQTTQVAFNGVNASTFSVNTNTQVTATVPDGATTGPITVTTPRGNAISPTNFTVSSQCQ